MATATHVIPKKAIAKFLGFYFDPKSEKEFIDMFNSAGFSEPILIKTEPPNISIGVARKG